MSLTAGEVKTFVTRFVVMLALVTTLTGCLPKASVIPDPSIPHRVAREAVVEVWVRRGDGKLVRERVRLLEGWWVASPQVVEP